MQHITDDSPLERRYPNLLEYVRSITNKRGRALLLERLSGEALEGLGQKHNVTAERIRQITSKQLKKRPCLMEDRYIEVFQKYCFEKQDFMVAFDEPELTYNYLILMQKPFFILWRTNIQYYFGIQTTIYRGNFFEKYVAALESLFRY